MTQSQIWHHAPLKLPGLSVNVSKGSFEKVVEMSTDSFLGVKFWPATLSSYLGHVEVVNFCCFCQFFLKNHPWYRIKQETSRNLNILAGSKGKEHGNPVVLHHGHPYGKSPTQDCPAAAALHTKRSTGRSPRNLSKSFAKLWTDSWGETYGETQLSWAELGREFVLLKGLDDVPKKVKMGGNMEHINGFIQFWFNQIK